MSYQGQGSLLSLLDLHLMTKYKEFILLPGAQIIHAFVCASMQSLNPGSMLLYMRETQQCPPVTLTHLFSNMALLLRL